MAWRPTFGSRLAVAVELVQLCEEVISVCSLQKEGVHCLQ